MLLFSFCLLHLTLHLDFFLCGFGLIYSCMFASKAMALMSPNLRASIGLHVVRMSKDDFCRLVTVGSVRLKFSILINYIYF